MKRTRLIKAIETLEAAVNLIEKCGGPGGKPGPCPKPKPAEGGESKPPLPKPLKSLNSKQKEIVFDHLDRLFHSPNELDWNHKSVLVTRIAMKFNLTKPLASKTFDEWGASDPQSRSGKYPRESYPKSSAWTSEPVNLSDVK